MTGAHLRQARREVGHSVRQQLQVAAAEKPVSLPQARRAGQTIAVGPGTARFHAGLDKVNDVMDQAGALRARVADERLEFTLLRDEFADGNLGTVSHCWWSAPTGRGPEHAPARSARPGTTAGGRSAVPMLQLGTHTRPRTYLTDGGGRSPGVVEE